MEENMGVDIPNEEAEKIGTVEAAINTFYRHLNEKADKAKIEQK
jgi:acyl carrier protein